MCAKWKEGRKNPDEIISMLEKSRNKNSQNMRARTIGKKASFDAFAFSQYTTALFSYIDFNREISTYEQFDILKSALFNLGEKEVIEGRPLLEEIKRLERNYLRKTVNDYKVVTNLSITLPKKAQAVVIQGVQIRFYKKIPPRFTRETVVQKARHNLSVEEPQNYTWVAVSIKARTAHDAMNKGILALDLLRGGWNLQLNRNRGLTMFSSKPLRQSVNKIHIGPIHTLHFKDGSLASEQWWYQSDYSDAKEPFDINKNWGKHENMRKKINQRLRASYPFSDLLRESIVQYTTALDTPDFDNVFLRLWALLENLTLTQKARYNDTVHRAAFFFSNYHLVKEILEHLRERRNLFVHQAQSMQDSNVLVYELDYICVIIIEFLLSGARNIKSFEEYKAFLDSPYDKETQKNKIRILNMAKEFCHG